MIGVAQDKKEPQPDGVTESQLPRGGDPPSFVQQRLWFFYRLRPGSPAYNLPAALHLTGRLDAAVAERSLGEVVHRHEALRTVFRTIEEQLIQVVLPEVPCPLPVVDLSHLPAVEREAEATRRMAVEFRRAFDLERGPLLRAGLLRLTGEEHVLWLVVHHIACDGVSMGILFQDLAAVYAAFLRGEPSPLPPLAVHYADYATAQRSRMQGETLRKHLSYWKQRLDGLAESLKLPTERPTTIESARQGRTRFFSLPRALTEALEALGRREVTWLFMTLLAGFQALLQRYSGQHDIAVVAPVTDRPRELQKMIGCFLNLVVLRTDLSGDPSFRELLGRVRSMALRAYAHQELPFDRLVQELRPGRVPGRQPLVRVMFTLLDDPTRGMALPGLKVAPIEVDCGDAQYDLRVTLTRTETCLNGAFEYDSSLFDAATIDRMTGHFEVLLGAAVADPDSRLSDLSLLDVAERRLMLDTFNDTAQVFPRPQLLHRLLIEGAGAHPDAVAASCEGESLTYADLDQRSAALARRLRAIGAGPGQRVAVCLDRSVDLMVGLWAVLRAGAAYVPLDPCYPAERLAFMLRDARPTALLTASLANLLPELPSDLPVLRLDLLHLELKRDTDHSPVDDGGVTPADPAYLIYTSGSTGRPKGALISHRGICNRLLWMQDEYRLMPDDVVLQKTPVGFDVSVWELFWPGLAGVPLVLARPSGHKDPDYLADLIHGRGVTVLHFVPSMLRAFLNVPKVEKRCRRLRLVVCSGEALPRPLADEFLARLPWCRLENLYGPTEAAVDVSSHTCRLGNPGPVPIGRPIANTRLYVLDGRRRPAPVGVPGEVYIGGIQVGLGYHDRPDLTADRFVPDELGPDSSGRLYRTGDLGRWLVTGELEYLGRLDHQVKIRGCRIELGEVEAALLAHPGVREAVADAPAGPDGERRLVAYVVPRAPVEKDELRTHLQELVPDYMVPSALVLVGALPLSPNGKVDRKALPAPAPVESGGLRPVVPPRDQTEAELARLWREALGEDSISVTDDFYSSGGTSLLAMSLLARVERTFGRKVSLAQFFQAPTIEAVAASIREDTWEDPHTRVFAMREEGTQPPLIIVDAGPVFRPLVRWLGSDQPVFGLSLPEVSELPNRYAMSDIAANLVEALCASGVDGPYHLAGWSVAGIFAYEMARQLRSRGKEVILLTLFDTTSSEYWRSFLGWRKLPVRVYLWLEKVLYHLNKSRAMPLRQAWKYFRERMTMFQSPARKGGWASGTANWQRQYITALDYRSEPCETPMLLFRSTALRLGLFRDPLLGWGKVAWGGMTVLEMPGEHDTMLLEPDVQRLAALWKECVQRVSATSGGACRDLVAPGPVGAPEFPVDRLGSPPIHSDNHGRD
jgi:amino acid adenylation domain-containing protein